MSTRVVALSLALLLASCNSENELSLPAPPAGYPTAYATRDCAPADGPATRLYLAAEPSEALPPPVPFVDVAIWQGVGPSRAGSSSGPARRMKDSRAGASPPTPASRHHRSSCSSAPSGPTRPSPAP